MKEPQRIGAAIQQLIPGATAAKTTSTAAGTQQPADDLQLSHLWLNMNPVKYLLVDIPETQRHLTKCQYEYNEKIKAELLVEFPGTDKESKLKRNAGFKNRSLKTEYIDTAIDLICMFNAHLVKLKRTDLFFKEFTTNNVALGKRMRNAGRKSGKPAHKATAWRHIKMLRSVNFINGKPFINPKKDKKDLFHGRQHNYGLILNEEGLIAQEKNEYNMAILQSYQVQNNMKETPVEILSTIENLRPDFNGFFTHKWLQVATHSITRTIIENHNLDSAIFVNNSKSADADLKLTKNEELPIAPAIGNEQPELEHRGKAQASAGNTPPIAPAPPAKIYASDELSFAEYDLWLKHYVKHSISVMLCVLYPHYKLWVDGSEYNLVYGYIQNFYGTFSSKNRPKTYRAFSMRSKYFTQIIVATQKQVLRRPNNYVVSPGKWLNPLSPNDFNGVKSWVDRPVSKEDQEKYKEHTENTNLLCDLIEDFFQKKEPSIFINGEKLLSRKKNKMFLQIFNKCVINKAKYTHETFAALNYQTSQN